MRQLRELNKIQTSVVLIIYLTLFLISVTQSFAENFVNVPVNIQAALFMKLLVFNKDISEKGDVSLYVIGSPDFAAEMKKEIGNRIGKSPLRSVRSGESLPSLKPSVIYLGNAAKLDDVINYTKKNKVLSITGIPELVSKGITLGIGAFQGKPRVLINLSASKREAADWNPAILKISTIFK